jgi:hypothetical protein
LEVVRYTIGTVEGMTIQTKLIRKKTTNSELFNTLRSYHAIFFADCRNLNITTDYANAPKFAVFLLLSLI